MSTLIRTINLIKTHRDRTWLTHSQEVALERLLKAMRVPGTVNLCGPVGVGKTFLAWILVDELEYTYFPHRDLFEAAESVDAPGVIVDNVSSSREAHRGLLTALRLRDVRRAIIITRQVVQDYTHYVPLALTPGDVVKVWENLGKIGLVRNKQRARTLWDLVNPSL